LKLDSLVPLASVADVSRSIEFYARLGFEVLHSYKPEDRILWVWLRSGNAHVMLGTADEPVIPSKQGVLFYLYAIDVAGMRERLVRNGVEAGPIQFPFYNPRGEFKVVDPDGYVLMIAHSD
jgi:hypothetical protein